MLRAISAAVFVAVLWGCASSVTVNDPTIPDPLVEKIPISVAIRFPDEFAHFVHEEEMMGQERWTVDLGRSNELLFIKLFSSMFDELTVLEDSRDPGDLPIDAFIEPTIDAFEFSTPNQSQSEAFAVWIRYRLKIFDNEGKQTANWPISAYGKSQSTAMGGNDALRRAAVLAMRDAAALIIMQMDKATRISRLGGGSVSRVAATPESVTPDPAIPETAEEETQTTADEEMTDESG
jgi:hypothetical protein